MSIFECDADEVRKMLEEEAREIGYKVGLELGLEQGIKQGIQALIETCKELGQSKEETTERMMRKYEMTPAEAAEYVEKIW